MEDNAEDASDPCVRWKRSNSSDEYGLASTLVDGEREEEDPTRASVIARRRVASDTVAGEMERFVRPLWGMASRTWWWENLLLAAAAVADAVPCVKDGEDIAVMAIGLLLL